MSVATLYVCSCGWSGERPSITDASHERTSTEGGHIEVNRVHGSVCPRCSQPVTLRFVDQLPVRGLTMPEWIELHRDDLTAELRAVSPRWRPESPGIDAQTEFEEFCESRYRAEQGRERAA